MVEGPVQVVEALQTVSAYCEHAEVETVFVDAELDPSQLRSIQQAGPDVELCLVAPGVLGAVLSTVNPQPAAALVRIPQRRLEDFVEVDGPVVVMVDVADPGNVGTMIRTAEAAGVGAVVACGHTADWTNPKVVRAAAGACLRLPVVVQSEPIAVLQALAETGRPVLAATVHPDAAVYDQVDLTRSVIVLGNEANGLNDETVQACDRSVTIPLGGPTESLNVATAGAVLCFESLRQRRHS